MSSSSFLLLVILSLLSSSLVSSQVSSGYCFSYTFTGGNSAATQWTVTASGLISTSSTLSSTLRNSATVTGITGTRTFYNATFSNTVSFTGITAGTAASNAVFSSYPYTDTTGWQIATSGPVYYETGSSGSNSIHLWQSYDPLLEVSGGQTIYVGSLKVTTQSTVSAVSACPVNVTLPVSSLQAYTFCWYLSDPYLDQYGWLVTADSNLYYPLGLSASPDINFEFDQFASAQYIDLNADNVNYMQSSNQGYAFAPYNHGSAHAVCKKNNNTATALTPATTSFTFCYVFYGADAINGAWQITSSGTITTYAQPVNTSSPSDAFRVGRQGYVAIDITGTRVWSNSSLTVTRNILGLVADTQVFEATKAFDNVIYASYPYVDGSGLSFYLDGPVLPYSLDAYGKTLNNVTFVSIATTGYNPLKELPTGGEEGSLIIRPASSNANLPSQCASLAAGSTSQVSFCYFVNGDKSSNDLAPLATWNISVWGVATVAGPFEREGQANTYRVISATGQRLLTVTSSTGVTTSYTQNIVNIRAPNYDTVSFGFLSNNVLYRDGLTTVGAIPGSASMKIDEYGLIFQLDGNAIFPTNTGTVTASGPDVNLCTDQFGTFQYYEESVYNSSLVTQSANSGMSLNSYSSGAVSGFTCPNTPASWTPNGQSSSGSSGLSGGAIAGIVVGVVVGVILLLAILVAVCMAARRGDKSGSKHLGGSNDASESSQVQNGQVELESSQRQEV